MSNTFPPHLQYIKNPKPLELGTWNFHTMFTTCHVSCVKCHMSNVTCHLPHVYMSHVFFYIIIWQIGGAGLRKVCYRPGLHPLVSLIIFLFSSPNRLDGGGTLCMFGKTLLTLPYFSLLSLHIAYFAYLSLVFLAKQIVYRSCFISILDNFS